MKKRTPLTTYQLAFIPRGEEAIVSSAEASAFAEQLHAEFGYSGTIEVNPLNDKQHVVYLPVKRGSIRKIVEFMQTKGFGKAVAERWWLNSVQSFDPWSMVTGINTATIPVSDWIGELPK